MRCTTDTDTRALIRRVRRGVEANRTVDPGYGLVELTEAGLQALCTTSRISAINSDSITAAFILTPPFEGESVLLVRADLPDLAQQVVKCWACAKRRRPRPCKDDREAFLIALAAVFHAEGMALTGDAGRTFQHSRILELRDVQGLWIDASLGDLLAVLDLALPALRPEPPESDQPISARELLSIAKKARDKEGDLEFAFVAFLEAARTARRAHEWDEMVRALLGLGRTCDRIGRYGDARRWYTRAVQKTREHDLRHLTGEVYHDRFTLEAECELDAPALQFATLAFEHYGARHPALYQYAQDVAWHLVNQGYFLRAFRILCALEVRIGGPSSDRLHTLANLSVASAAVGDTATCARAADELRAELIQPYARGYAARGHLALAEAFAREGRWVAAATAACRAEELAADQGLREVRKRAVALRGYTERRVSPPARRCQRTAGGEAAWEELVTALERAIREHPLGLPRLETA